MVTVVYIGIVGYHDGRRKTALFAALVTWREPYGATSCCARNADGASRLRVSRSAGPAPRQVEAPRPRDAPAEAGGTSQVFRVEAKHSWYLTADVDGDQGSLPVLL